MPRHRHGVETPSTGAAGFTLIEMAIVMIIFGLLVGGGLVGLGAYMEKQARDQTLARLDKVERALTLFVITHGYLPCPTSSAAPNPGEALDCGGGGGVSVGQVPYLSLGLQRVEAQDGWHNYFTYAVDSNQADDADGDKGTGTFYGDGSAIGNLAKDYKPSHFCARLEVEDKDGNPPKDEAGAGESCSGDAGYGTARAAYVLVSHGQNGFGAVTNLNSGATIAGTPLANEDENVIGDGHPEQFREAGDDILRARTIAQIIRDAQG